MTGIEAGWQERDLAAKFLAGIGTTFGTSSPEFGPPGPKTNSCQVSFRDYFSGLLFHFRMAKLELTRKLTRFLPGFSQTAFSNPKSWQDSCQDFCTTKSL